MSERSPTALAEVETLVEEAFGTEAADVVADESYTTASDRVADSLVAVGLLPGRQGREDAERLAAMTRAFDLLERVAADDDTLAETDAVPAALDRHVALEGSLFAFGGDDGPATDEGSSEDAPDFEQELADIQSTKGELLGLTHSIDLGGEEPVDDSLADLDRESLRERFGETVDELEAIYAATADEATEGESFRAAGQWLATDGVTDSLSDTSRATLERADIDPERTPLPVVIQSLEAREAMVGGLTVDAAIDSWRDYEARDLSDLFGGVSADRDVFDDLVDLSPPPGQNVTALGVGELRTVRESLPRYEMGELAHIENVMAREERDRTHRQLTRSEEETLVDRERETEETRDLQTTERFELQRETERVIEAERQTEAGVSVSASYGPSVQVEGNFGVASRRATRNATRTASRYARDVTERAVKRIQTREREHTVSRLLRETEETNHHGFDNTEGTDHVVGMYRFVDRLSTARVHADPTPRHMYEFLVPEPAAFYLRAQQRGAAADVGMRRPPEPRVNGRPLRSDDITVGNYQSLAASYGATVEQPPAPTRTVTDFAKKDLGDKTRKATYDTKTLTVPEGYETAQAAVSTAAIYRAGNDHSSNIRNSYALGVTIADAKAIRSSQAGTGFHRGHYTTESMSHFASGDVVPVLVRAYNIHGYAIGVSLLCTRTERAMTAWQTETYQAIMSAYENRKAAYDDAVSAAEISGGVAIGGNAPARNRDIERTELKKAAISLLRDSAVDIDAVDEFSEGALATIDFDALGSERERIQFLEHAFEWDQATYVFYPYFWARQSEWAEMLQRDSPDPTFGAFLRAGAARLVVPVRPGYEFDVVEYIETGVPYAANGQPTSVTSDQFVDIVDELKAQQRGDTDAPPTGESWPIRLPTSLVMLQDDATLPNLTATATPDEGQSQLAAPDGGEPTGDGATE